MVALACCSFLFLIDSHGLSDTLHDFNSKLYACVNLLQIFNPADVLSSYVQQSDVVLERRMYLNPTFPEIVVVYIYCPDKIIYNGLFTLISTQLCMINHKTWYILNLLPTDLQP